jgi:class 3 adenylate cyclase
MGLTAYTRHVPICASCGRDNPAGAKFCNECAAPLTAPVLALEERKIVSVLFCDLVGFTAASERQDPEDVQARIRPYYARLRREIERYGGTVEKFVGDAVMGAFGAPAAHEDDAERAVRSGLAIIDAIADLNESTPGLDLQVRVGINTGKAVVALAARPEHGEGFVTGDVVNTASRIESAAPPNAVAVSDATYRATSRVFEYQPLEPVSVKGKIEPLRLWRAIVPRARYGSDIRRSFTTPFIGRELEKALLIGTFERTLQQRSVQLVTVVGEPGVGKSRLVSELLSYADAKPGLFRWKQGRCLPYGEGITFWALGEIVKAEAGILESDSAEVATVKLDATVPPDEPDRQWLRQLLAPLVGVESGSAAERRELFTAWRRYLEALAGGRPSVLVFEDLHWADDALLEFLEYLGEWSHGVSLLVICVARPELYERRPGWGAGLRNVQTIDLSPLTDQETSELVGYLSRNVVLDAELERAILERAGGNPLYAEEFIRLLADRALDPEAGTLDEMTLPDSIQALIAARLDTLPSDRKALLQDAAVMGKVFWIGALAAIAGRDPADVELDLHELARKELVRPVRTSSMAGELEYAFWHLLVRDVAYSQIPRAERVRRHRAAAGWIEEKAGERVEDLAEVLAHHYLQALELVEALGDADQAAELAAPTRHFLALAGERALGLDTEQAEARLARAVELAPLADPERAVLTVRWAEAATQAGHFLEAAESLDAAFPSLYAHGDPEITARALQLRSRLSNRMGDGRQVALALQAVELLEREAPDQALVAAYAQLANVQAITGAYREAITAAERALTLTRTLGLPEPARALSYRGFARVYLGDAGGLPEMERAFATLAERGAGRDAASVLNNLGLARYPLEGPSGSLADWEQAVSFCEQRGLLEVKRMVELSRLSLLPELGRVSEALELAGALGLELEETGDTQNLIELRAVELTIRMARGERGRLAAAADWLIEASRAQGTADIVNLGFGAAAAAVAPSEPERASGLLAELERSPGSHESTYYVRQLPALLRMALSIGDVELAERLAGSLEPRYPVDEHALCAARAQLAEHRDATRGAAALYGEAAARWEEFGNVAERAYALLGEGRCLHVLDDERAGEALREARALFTQMGYAPAVAEVDSLLGPAVAGAPTVQGPAP